MPQGASAKRAREYDDIKHQFHDEDRDKGREEEVAARIAYKQPRLYGETKAQKTHEREERSPAHDLPLEGYRHLTIPQVKRKLHSLSQNQIRQLKQYEQGHKNRRTLIAEYDRALEE